MMKPHRHWPPRSAGSHRYRVAFLAALLLSGALLLLGGCAKKESSQQPQSEPPSSTSSSSAPQTQRPANSKLTAAELRWGVAPPRNDSRFVYEDDVVIVDHGADAVRSLSPNGMIWTIDANAPHADQVQPGKIMFLTSRAVGRVINAERRGNDLAVILGPVDLTDIYKEAHVTFQQTFHLSDAIIYPAPYPGAEDAVIKSQVDTPANQVVAGLIKRTPPPSYELLHNGAMPVALRESTRDRFEGSVTDNGAAPFVSSFAPFPTLEPSNFYSLPFQAPQMAGPLFTLTKGDFDIAPCCRDDRGLGIQVIYSKDGLDVRAGIELLLKSWWVKGKLDIRPTKNVEASLELGGAIGLNLGFEGATKASAFVNITAENGDIVLPVDVSFPLPSAGPFALTIRQHMILTTAFSAKNSALLANAEYKFGGSIRMGYQNGSFVAEAPNFKATNNVVSMVRGGSLGASVILMGLQNKLILGVGAGGFVVGPYFGYNTFVTGLRGSDQTNAFGVPTCVNARLIVSVDAGLGYAMPQAIVNAINFFLRPFLKAAHFEEVKSEGAVKVFKPKPIKNVCASFPGDCAGPCTNSSP
jgi:hypothetical protein